MNTNKKEQFFKILNNQKIFPVYQPIVSLSDGTILGYEALSRIALCDSQLSVEEMFKIAEELKCTWRLEKICRDLSLQNASGKQKGHKLFLNVDANVIHDKNFKTGMTYTKLKEYGLDVEDIVFEITERTAVEDLSTFKQSLHHYREQNYEIAIDDVGSGYSSLARVCEFAPNFLKIDMSIIRNIDTIAIKKSLLASFVQFCKDSRIKLIAEGIETKEELETLIGLGIAYGQGYFLQRPLPTIENIPVHIKDIILEFKSQEKNQRYQPSFFGSVEHICKPKHIVFSNQMGVSIFQEMKVDISMTEVCVLNENHQVQGIVTRTDMYEHYGGRYGYNLNMKKTAQELMYREFLVVDATVSIEIVSKMALARLPQRLYDAVVVTKNEQYLGVVTVKDLLESAITIQVKRAVEANPLTGLPGNTVIEQLVERCLKEEKEFTVMYLDLDNFKAYNDAYGFNNGDIMIRLVADCMRRCCIAEEFIGHVGGDDFVIIAKYWDVEPLCYNIIEQFRLGIRNLYCETDYENGCIISKNRNGFKDTFPLATLSIAIASNQEIYFKNLDEFSKQIAMIKKAAKQEFGNCVRSMRNL